MVVILEDSVINEMVHLEVVVLVYVEMVNGNEVEGENILSVMVPIAEVVIEEVLSLGKGNEVLL